MVLGRVGLIAVLLAARGASAQIDAHAIETDLKGKAMGLRSYSAEPVAKYEWVDDKFVSLPGHLSTLGVFTTRSVKLKGNALTIEGNRGTLVRDVQKNRLVRLGEAPMRLEVDLRNAPATVKSSMLEKMLFIQDVAKAIAGLPMPLQEMLPQNSTGGTPTKCKCSMIFDGGQWTKLAHDDPHYSYPKLKFSIEPEFSEEARKQKVAGSVVVVIYIDSVGHVEDLARTALGVWARREGGDCRSTICLRPSGI
jgi:hypothetical protein